MDKIYIIILNWNGWQDSIECLESVFRNDYPSYQVLLCDNGSRDGSLDKIKSWAKGELRNEVPSDHPLYSATFPPVAKPVSFAECDRAEAESGRVRGDAAARLVLIRMETNLGFAGGNNVGLRYALSRNDFSHVWLLNNDVVIKPDALTRLVERMREKRDAGMCGSTIPYYSRPSTVWALGGGTYNRWLARSRNIGHLQAMQRPVIRDKVEASLDYLAGASMLVSRDFLNTVGLMCEDYFLYYEEPDWALRARERYTLAYAPASIVYHKIGASTDMLDRGMNRLGSSLFYAIKSHFRFTLKFYPLFLPVVLLRQGVQLFLLALISLVRLGTTSRSTGSDQ